MRVQRDLSFAIDALMQSRMTPHSSGSLVGIERRHLAGLLELGALVHDQRRVAAVVDDQRRAAGRRATRAPRSVHHQYSSSVSPFQAKTGVPFGFCGVPPVSGRPTTTAAAA